jgi:hypothetical protein
MWNFDQPTTDLEVLQAFPKEGAWLSRKDIADALRRAKTPSLIARINSLVERGYLLVTTRTLPNRVDMFYYSLTERALDAILHGGLTDETGADVPTKYGDDF